MKAKVALAALLIMLSLLFSSCAGGNRMIGSWKDASYTGPVKGRVLVVGVARNDTHRRIFEDSLVVNLKTEGVDGVAGYTFADDGVEPTEAAIRAVMKQSGASTVLVTHVIGSGEKNRYFPAIGDTFVGRGYYGGLHSYYPRVYNFVYMPAQNVNTETVTLETGLYDGNSGQLIWIGRSEAVNPEMTKKYYTGLTKLFVKDLRKKNLIP